MRPAQRRLQRAASRHAAQADAPAALGLRAMLVTCFSCHPALWQKALVLAPESTRASGGPSAGPTLGASTVGVTRGLRCSPGAVRLGRQEGGQRKGCWCGCQSRQERRAHHDNHRCTGYVTQLQHHTLWCICSVSTVWSRGRMMRCQSRDTCEPRRAAHWSEAGQKEWQRRRPATPRRCCNPHRVGKRCCDTHAVWQCMKPISPCDHLHVPCRGFS